MVPRSALSYLYNDFAISVSMSKTYLNQSTVRFWNQASACTPCVVLSGHHNVPRPSQWCCHTHTHTHTHTHARMRAPTHARIHTHTFKFTELVRDDSIKTQNHVQCNDFGNHTAASIYFESKFDYEGWDLRPGSGQPLGSSLSRQPSIFLFLTLL